MKFRERLAVSNGQTQWVMKGDYGTRKERNSVTVLGCLTKHELRDDQ